MNVNIMQNADLTVKSKMREEYLGLKKKKSKKKYA